MGSQEVLDKGIDLSQSQSAPALEVILSPKAAVVEGLVRDGDKPVAGMFVTLVPEPFRFEKRYLIKNGTTDQNGAFSIKSVAPGAYRAYAWEEMVPLGSSLDAELVKLFEGKSTKMSVSESGRERLELTVIKPEDARP